MSEERREDADGPFYKWFEAPSLFSSRSELSHHYSKNCSPDQNLKPDLMDVAARDDLIQARHAWLIDRGFSWSLSLCICKHGGKNISISWLYPVHVPLAWYFVWYINRVFYPRFKILSLSLDHLAFLVSHLGLEPSSNGKSRESQEKPTELQQSTSVHFSPLHTISNHFTTPNPSTCSTLIIGLRIMDIIWLAIVLAKTIKGGIDRIHLNVKSTLPANSPTQVK